MQIKPTSYVMNYIETFDMSNLTTLDYYIIQKNISIYLNNNIAISKLNECCNYFEVNNYNRLVIASQITLATKHAQIGEIKQAKEILEQIYENKFLGMQDVIYIENNMAVFDFLEDNITEKTLNKLKAAFAFCNDEYTHLLIINNILIYYVQSNKFKEASLYAEELETIGYKTYCFDDYLHLTILNLRYYYSKINASNQIAKCNLQLKKYAMNVIQMN